MSRDRDVQFRQVTVVPAGGAGGAQFVNEVGKKLVQDLGSAGLNGVYLPALRDASPVDRRDGQDISFHDGDLLVEVGEHTGGQKSADAGAQYQRMGRARRPRHHSRSIARAIRAVSK